MRGFAVGVGPVGPQAGHQHGLAVARGELQHLVLAVRAGNVLVEGVHHQDGVVAAEGLAPVVLQGVAAGVIGAGMFVVVGRRLAGQPAPVAHGLDHPPPALTDDDGRIRTGKQAVVARQRLGAAQVGQLLGGPGDLVSGYAHVAFGLLSDLGLQGALGAVEAGRLCEQLLLPALGLAVIPDADLRGHLGHGGVFGQQEGVVHALGGLGAGLAGVVEVELGEVLQRHDGAVGADQLAIVGFDLGGVAHGGLMPQWPEP